MKRLITKLFLTACAVSVFFSCTKDTTESAASTSSGEKVEASFSATIGTATRVHDSAWDENDAIGLAMLVNGGTEIINDVYNYHYVTATGDGRFEPSNPLARVYFPQDGSLVTFRAYYPYYSALGTDMLIPVSTANQTILPDIDLLSADHISGYSKQDPYVQLTFHYRLSKLIFVLRNQDDGDFVDPADLTLTVKGMYTTGTYDLRNEVLNIDVNSMADMTFPGRESDEELYGIVLPREAGDGVVFEFTKADGSSFTAKMSDTLNLEGGYQYTFYITMQQTDVTVSATIEPWLDGPTTYYDAVQVSTEAGESLGVNVGDVMNLYVEEDEEYGLLQTFTYNTDGK
ncbi:MAG: fimbrillin family protein [Rikenellaceae bacterium]|nr:fimbrillin family protein [Rikenellaceae bacterium]